MNLNSLRALFTDKQKPFLTRLILLFCSGIALLIGSTFFDRDEGVAQIETAPIISTQSEPAAANSELYLERRLANVLSLVEGAGKVEVMLTFSQSREIVLAEDGVINESSIKEEDSAGGSRESSTSSKDMRTILVQSPRGGQEPIILREIVPRVEGVIIVAQGGDNVFVREALMHATRTVLGVDIHRVQVLQMQSTD